MKKFLFLLLIPMMVFARRLEEFRAVKITNVDSDVLSSHEKIAEAMDYLASINVNTVLVVVWNGSGYNGAYTLFPSAVMDSLFGFEKGPTGSVEDPLDRVIIEAHRNGIEVLPWFEYGFASSYNQNGGHIVQKYPHWATLDYNGNLMNKNGFDWISAINPEVQGLISGLTMEVCRSYDIDGVEYSDRIPALPVEGGYDSVTVSIYKAEHDGAEPPKNYKDASWMRWRADKMNDWFRAIRDSVKAYDPNLNFSSSPSIYPWCYHEYLQDPYTWMNEDIVDDVIPQLYRYDFGEYQSTFLSSLANYPGKKDVYIAGILMNVGDYIISPEYLMNAMEMNRDQGIAGEAFFFYEGLRKNGNQLGRLLKESYYEFPAYLPHRGENVWRPKAHIVNENENRAKVSGNWETLTSDSYGFNPNILINKNTEYAEITYNYDVPYAAWFDLYAYVVRSPKATKLAKYTVYAGCDSFIVNLDQTSFSKTGWQKLSTLYLKEGEQTLVKLDNSNINDGEWLIADATMLMLNRKKSKDIFISPDMVSIEKEIKLPESFILEQNYPNPFNASTYISYSLPKNGLVSLKIFDILGKEIKVLVNQPKSAGNYTIHFDAKDLSSGLYFYQLIFKDPSATDRKTRKLMIVK
ncbi:MAG: family 10 glycosylhydrolase [Candidatus Marinimicrobia bacterium]|nr:family 10 glycosylhydrolase [Candidatus Neomarinimicrobiota bacterium]